MRIKLHYLWLPAAWILLFSSCHWRRDDAGNPPVKFHPGHYVAAGPSYDLPGIRYLDDPAVRGVNKRYYWRLLEPERGVYDFSSIEEDLRYLAAHEKQLVVFLVDRSFWIKGAMPDYLSGYEIDYGEGGFCPVRWDPVVVDRFLALGKALGERFDADPNFEGIAIQETSLDLAEEDYEKFNYTTDGYRDALITLLTGLKHDLPRSHVFWYQNFFDNEEGNHIEQIAEAIKDSGIFMGGPDILPYNRWYNKKSYPLYDEFKNSITLFCSAQDDSYRHHKNDIRVALEEPVPAEGYLTMEEIFLFARDSLHVRYLFWNYYYEGTEVGERSYEDAIRVIRKYPIFNDSTGPFL